MDSYYLKNQQIEFDFSDMWIGYLIQGTSLRADLDLLDRDSNQPWCNRPQCGSHLARTASTSFGACETPPASLWHLRRCDDDTKPRFVSF